ncbi:unnamed protein product [Polarella glacialis]|uniref:Uncharacterized protein n=1 Tax=Polarella glacialis TaxID=89957 RepID=A0A813IUM1_POLGL|nr:unnamed protein product [Polarella glacialis]
MPTPGGVTKEAGVFGFGYNRVNYKFDQGQRWARYIAGRQQEIKRAGMFREDVTDLASVAVSKLKIYCPLLTMGLGYVMTIFVEARSGLKFPAPPTFASGMYLQTCGVAFAFMTLAIWLCFHAAMRAQVAMVHLRTRSVRLPVPTQRQLDSARKILSTYEEQGVYDMFRLPFVMPNGGNSPDVSDGEGGKLTKEADKAGYSKGGMPGVAAKMKGKVKDLKAATKGSKKEMAHSVRIPGTTSGAPSWIQKEFEAREHNPKSSPSANGLEAPSEPYAHFELMREAQKEYWCAEAYTRVCFLFGWVNLIQSFAYWLTIHVIAELAMVWCAFVCAIALTAGNWIMFRLDVLPEHGGCLPVELAGPIVCAISLAMAYTHDHNPATIDISRAVAILIILMQIGFTFRMYTVAKPSWNVADHTAKESGGRHFNQSAACDRPAWLPSAFQHVSYLVGPPKTPEQLAKEKEDGEGGAIREDPLMKVDMTPWWYVRTVILFSLLGWVILLTGRIQECAMGERMLLTNPGAPPWSRAGQWAGWESGPTTSKHYSHVTPMRGHFAWQQGWGPQGRQEVWASDMFGFHPEADAHWHEEFGPEPLEGAAGHGKNTWAAGVIKYGERHEESDELYGEPGEHSFDQNGGHRRLRNVVAGEVRPVVPAAVQWPAMLEPDFLACSAQDGQVAAVTATGFGAMVPEVATSGRGAGAASSFTLEGLVELGMARGVSWGASGSMLIATGSGAVAFCPAVDAASGNSRCSPMPMPKLPYPSDVASPVAAVIESVLGEPLRAAVAAAGGRVQLHELTANGMNREWRISSEVLLPLTAEGQSLTPEIVSISANNRELLVTTADGSTFQWQMRDGKTTSEAHREAPAAGPRRTWRSACSLSTGKVMRLASNWRHSAAGPTEWHHELLI